MYFPTKYVFILQFSNNLVRITGKTNTIWKTKKTLRGKNNLYTLNINKDNSQFSSI